MALVEKYLALALMALFAAIGVPHMAKAQGVPTKSAQVLTTKDSWQNFLKIAAKPNAIVTVKDLEKAFGGKAVLQQVGVYNFYQLREVVLSPDGNPLARARYPAHASLFVSYDFSYNLEEQTCVTDSQAVSDLERMGWVLHDHTWGVLQGNIRETPPADAPYGTYTFTRDDQGVLRLAYSEKTHCATTVHISSDKLDFDRITDTKPDAGPATPVHR